MRCAVTHMNICRKKVLVVEDDPQNMQMLLEVLNLYGYDSLSAYDGEEGAQKALSCNPDLVLMDIQLPVLDGFGALKKIRMRQQRQIPVIAVTACFDDRDILIKTGFDDFIPKPIDIEMFSLRLNFILGNN